VLLFTGLLGKILWPVISLFAGVFMEYIAGLPMSL